MENQDRKAEVAVLTVRETRIELPVIKGQKGLEAVDISKLFEKTGFMTLDPGFVNTAVCFSAITFVDGEKGTLEYRGHSIQDLAEKENVDFISVAYLLNFGKLPSREERSSFRGLLAENEMLHEDMRGFFNSLPPKGDPMAILSAAVQVSSLYDPDLRKISPDNDRDFLRAAAKLISKIRTIAAWSFRKSNGRPYIYPDSKLDYCSNFLHMMFSQPNSPHVADESAVRALNLFLLLHADHEQNCSTTTVRMVGSSKTNLFDSVSSGISALSGILHGGANQEVIRLLEGIERGEFSVTSLIEKVKIDKSFKLPGFGHRIYKTFDPRAKILKKSLSEILGKKGGKDGLIEKALELEEVALADDYFKERNLYPNVDFYSGILLRAINIPTNMYPVMFAIARMSGWIAHWREGAIDQTSRIYRPRQVYIGP